MSWNSQAAEGKAFEELVIWANERYRRRGTAVIEKVPTEWIPIRGRNGQICTAKVERKAPVDFIGIGLGRAIAFDAKHTENERRIAWDRLEPHQDKFLRDWAAVGGIAFILVEWQHKSTMVIPITEWGREGKSLLLPEVEQKYRVKTQGGLPDYLEIVCDLYMLKEGEQCREGT